MGDSEYRPRLFIGGLKGPVDKDELQQAFAEFGNIVDVWVAYDPPGFAFVEYDNMDSAKAAKEQMHLTDLFDTQIRYVSREKPKKIEIAHFLYFKLVHCTIMQNNIYLIWLPGLSSRNTRKELDMGLEKR